ncbi:hypothetical protein K1719_002074 [Acacia pycnantha]|nr:hypothetical protein K1719_002074 [Acacia pycnantha]
MEMAASTVKDRPKSPPYRGRENQESHKKNPRARDSNDKNRDAKYEKYTPLKVSQAKLCKEVCTTEMKKVERPRPLGRRATADKTRFCEFHDQHGYTTEQCWDLRDAVEKFVRDGKLRKYVIQTQGKQGSKRGGFDGEGDSSSQRRKYLREVLLIRNAPKFKEDLSKPKSPVLCFTDKDLEDVAPGHHDGLVITGTLVNCRVNKIFVDNGSAVDIILWDAYKRMNFDADVLKPCKTTLTGFNGQDTRPKGYVDLKLTLGDARAFKLARVRFVVADFPSTYNIILGRPTIHNWDMLVSSKHQKLKMISKKNEVVTVKGDQKQSRQCYYNTVRNEPSRFPRNDVGKITEESS